MDEPGKQVVAGCSGQCSRCAGGQNYQPPTDAPSGARLVLWAFAAFLAPLCLAIAGALACRGRPACQAAAAAAGLALGICANYVVHKLVSRTGKEPT